MEELRNAIRAVSQQRFDGCLPWDQNTGTAFAVELTVTLTPPAPSLVLYAQPRPGSRKLIEQWGRSYIPGEMYVDIATCDLREPTDLRFLVGCESEMHENHGTGYSLDDQNGYTKDFRKLLRFPGPTLLFAARVRTERLSWLEPSLDACAKDFRSDWAGKLLLIVLLPSAYTRRELVTVGIGEPDGSLRFEPLDQAVAIT